MFQTSNVIKRLSDHRFLMALVILVAILVRLPGMFWGLKEMSKANLYFEPDEWAHSEIAKEFINGFDKDLIPDSSFERYWTSWGFGVQVGLVSYPFLKIIDFYEKIVNKNDFITIIARAWSLLFSLALILLTFFISQSIFQDNKKALLSAAFLSLFDLNVTYSHYGTPDIVNVFWFYLSIFLLSLSFFPNLYREQYAKIDKYSWFLIPLSIAMNFSVRFDIVPLVIFGSLLTWKFIRTSGRKIKVRVLLGGMVTIGAIAFLIFLFTGANHTSNDFLIAKDKLLNDNLPPAANLLSITLLKPALYLFVIIAGTSLPAFLVFMISLPFIFFLKKQDDKRDKFITVFWLSALLLSFLILFLGPAVTVRRANIFLPFVAIIVGWGLIHFRESQLWSSRSRLKSVIGALIIIYTGILTIFSQSSFLNDTRNQAEKFISAELPKLNLGYSLRAPTSSALSPKSGRLHGIVLHETDYSRYWKSLATPFRIPKCCSEVFRCEMEGQCLLTQYLFSGELPYDLVKEFKIKHPLPERIIFKQMFGTYETFLGDVRIYLAQSVIKNGDEIKTGVLHLMQ